MIGFFEQWAAASTDAARAIAYALSAAATGFLISRLAIYAWMGRAAWWSPDFSPNPASVMVGMLSVPMALFMYFVSEASSLALLDRLLAAFIFTCLETGPIVFVLTPLFAIYIYSVVCGAAISDRSIYVSSSLAFVGEIIWLMMFVARME